MTASPPTVELIGELQDVIDALGRDLVAAKKEMEEGAVRPERINAMFRSGHTLKGLFGMVGLKAAQNLAHGTEDVLEGMRMGRVPATRESVGLLLDCVDHFGRRVERDLSAQGANPLDDEVEPLLARLRLLSSASSPSAPAPPAASAPPAAGAPGDGAAAGLPPELRRMLTEYEEYRFEENQRLGRHLMAAQVALSLVDCDVALPALEAQLGTLGEIIARLPSAQIGADATIGFDILMAATEPVAAIGTRLGRPDVTLRPLGPSAGAQAPAAEAQAATPQAPGRAPAVPGPTPLLLSERAVDAVPAPGDSTQETAFAALQTVRVDIRRLDHLMHLVGELGSTRNVLGRLASKLRDASELSGLAAELEREGARLERRISMLQAQVLEARMVPLSTLFDRLVRAGTKVALELGLEAQFDTVGGQTELDKRIVEELADPLLHLVRNAIDHGLERPPVRKTTGKPALGTVRLSAQAQGGHVVVTVEDDGAGIDADAVARAAIKKGLISPDRAAELTAEQRLRLILLPGFSTRDEVSTYSGRGVGLDVVKTHLERLGGGVEISTRPGNGSTFALMAPATLAIMPALIVMAGGTPYAIPLAHVVETVGIEAPMVTPSQGLPTLQLRDRTLTLAPLTELLQLAPAQEPAQPWPYAVIVGLAARQTALAVSDVLGQQDIVIKPLGPRLSHVRGLAGAAQIDDLALVLVLDVMGLTQDVRQHAPRPQEIS